MLAGASLHPPGGTAVENYLIVAVRAASPPTWLWLRPSRGWVREPGQVSARQSRAVAPGQGQSTGVTRRGTAHPASSEQNGGTMSEQKASIGRIVHYTLGPGDVTLIEQQSPMVVNGFQVRNSVHEGDVYPAVIVRVFGAKCANLRVLLDGRADYWATSRAFDDPEVERTPRYSPTPDHEGPGYAGGTWHWPERV